jgi:hypothetical protein
MHDTLLVMAVLSQLVVTVISAYVGAPGGVLVALAAAPLLLVTCASPATRAAQGALLAALLSGAAIHVLGGLSGVETVVLVSVLSGFSLFLALRREDDWSPVMGLAYLTLALAVADLSGLPRLMLAAGGVVAWNALPVMYAHGRDSSRPAVVALLSCVVLSPVLATSWTDVLGSGSLGFLAAGMTAVSLLGAARLLQQRQWWAMAMAVIFLTVAVVLALQNEWLAIGLAVEGLLLAAVSRRLSIAGLRPVVLGLSVASVALLAQPAALSWHGTDGMVLLNWTLVAWGLPAAVLYLSSEQLERRSALVLQVLSALMAFALVNLQVAHAFSGGAELTLQIGSLAEEMARSLGWAGLGVAMLVLGLYRNHRSVRLIAAGVLGLAAAKVFLMDLWRLDGLVRVFSMLGLGILLVVAALLFQRLPGIRRAGE